MRATKAIIHLDKLTANIQLVRKMIGEERLICMPVKADAYGHGAVPIAKAALAAGAAVLAVATVDEGAELRQAGIDAPILLLSTCLPEEIPLLIQNDLEPFAGDEEFISLLEEAMEAQTHSLRKVKLNVHLKIDTGMGRAGCTPEHAARIALFITQQKMLHLKGTATHFAVSDSLDPAHIANSKQQIECFTKTIDHIKAAGIDPGIVHAANSGALAVHPAAWFDMVRPGLALYGYSPVREPPYALAVQPVMELASRIISIKRVTKGQTISYGKTWTAFEDTLVGIIPLGYGDGFPRLLSNQLTVLIRNTFYPQIGRICMDQSMVNLGPDTNVRRWDKVTIFGNGIQNAADLAAKIGTIPYEITCNINKRVVRVYEGA
ncbi:alanine racemase [Breznakiellaceae bacterium SP9]